MKLGLLAPVFGGVCIFQILSSLQMIIDYAIEYNFCIENMNSPIKHLYDYVQLCISFQERLQPYCLDQKSVEQLFAWLDKRRRGFIDVSDFYDKFPELQEDELFYIFKTIDVSRTGNLTLADLRETVMSPNIPPIIENICDIQRRFRGYIRLLKATYHSLESEKIKLNLRQQKIETCFEMVSMGKGEISIEDLARAFTQQGLFVERKLVDYMRKHIFQNGLLRAKQFLQIFTPLAETEPPKQTKGFYQQQKMQERSQINAPSRSNNNYSRQKISSKIANNRQIDSRIDEILRKYERPTSKQNCELTKVQRQDNFRTQFSNYTEENANNTRNLDKQFFEHSSSSKFGRTVTSGYDNFQQNKQKICPESHGNLNFNRRRQQLRKGSLERQRIIEDVLRKKNKVEDWDENCRVSPHEPDYAPPRYPAKQLSYNLRPQSASKLMNKAHSPTASAMNWTASKPDLQMFYKNTGESLAKNHYFQKENILKRAEQEASKKIQQIQRKARLKVMEKRSANGVYSRWLK